MNCGASAYLDEDDQVISIHSDGPPGGPADVGRAAHDIMKHQIKHEEYNFDEVCGRHEVKPKEVGFLSYASMRFVEVLESEFNVEEWVAEERLDTNEPFEFGGTPDIVGHILAEHTVILPDLKTGRVTTEYQHQMRSYAHLIFSTMPEVQTIVALIFWARDLELQKWTWTRKDNEKWLADVDRTIMKWDGKKFTVGKHCLYCRRSINCVARNKAMATGRDLILHKETADALVKEELKTAWTMAAMIIQTVESWQNRTEERAATAGGLDFGDGTELVMAEKNTKPVIYTPQTAAILKKDYAFSDEDVLSCCAIAKGPIGDLIGGRAPKGKMGSSRKEAFAALEKAGAIVPKTCMTAKIQKIKKEEKNV
jgi:hypothetical protein